jgi:hypothetical protein
MNLRRKNIQMDEEDYSTYYFPAMERILPTPKSYKGRTTKVVAFDMMLGVELGREYLGRTVAEDRPLPDDWRDFLSQLAGPYGQAILKAYRIKYGLEEVSHGIEA